MNHVKPLSVVGKGVPVKDAVEKVTGALKYAVDLTVQDMAHGRILRSPHPHARITRIDATRAEALPGVLAVLTHEDTPRFDWEAPWFNYRGKVLDGIARFVGDEVAAVAADSPEIAAAALDLIDVTYEPLPHVFDVEAARAPGAPQVRPEGNAREPTRLDWGDPNHEPSDSDLVVDCDIHFESQQYASLGRNACIAEWTADKLTVWTSTQTPSELRDSMVEALGIPQSKIRAIALPSGSSHGQWWVNNFMPVTVLLARKARRPVKIELDNDESMTTVKRRHEEHTRGRMACTPDGDLTLLVLDHTIGNGAYGYKNDVGFAAADLWGRTHNGRVRVTGINTNRLTAGCMRCVGDCTLGAAVERMADQLAERVGLDPIAFRLRNQIRAGDPLRKHGAQTPTAKLVNEASVPDELRRDWPELFRLSSGSTEALLRRGAERFRWSDRWAGWRRPNHIDGPRRRAIGVGTGAHFNGVELEGNADGIVRINPDGSVKVHCSAGRQGQGSETALAQIAAEAVGVAYDMVEIETGDTDSCPWSHGSIASNTAFRTGSGIYAAARDARRQVLAIAARDLFDGIEAEKLDITDGVVHPLDNPAGGPRVTIADVLNAIRPDSGGQTSSITGHSTDPMPPSTKFARHFAAHFIEVEVDSETGQVRILDYLATQDSGTVINPQVLKNQVIGGAILGLGFALYEQLVFDPETGAILNGNLLDYKLLRTADFPWNADVLFEESPDPAGPFGARGGGEAPVAAAVAAVSQAVYNAVGAWVDPPMTPERIVRALAHPAHQ